MKYILCVICVSAVAILLVSVNAGEEEENMLRQVAGGCINETGASDEDVARMANKKLPATPEGKCFTFCVLHLFNCLTEDGNFQQEDFMNLMRMGIDNDTVLAACDEVSKKCVGTKSSDDNNCETAALLVKCLDDGAKEAGYEKF
ncbi:general odorant-binding protein 69a-like [Bradysia coprophila]|uniref:general odorant-binding protein 69a-like n=1 Tax=Bradysia coprophila TaxID=38358 RepID=UPI00187DCC27|nr:general odorant-binding protein 69a-like [Bradysia coprophila]